MRKHNPLDERKKELMATGLCQLFDFRPESRTRIENYTFDFPADVEAIKLLRMATDNLSLVDSQLERIERITKAIMKDDNKTTAEACHIAEAVQYVTV